MNRFIRLWNRWRRPHWHTWEKVVGHGYACTGCGKTMRGY